MRYEAAVHATLESSDAEATHRLGFRLGALLQLGDVVCLDGELGAGKSCFARGLARGLGVPEEDPIHSPSFTLINEHDGRLPFVHADLYRIEPGDEVELDALGLDEYYERSVTAVEWFDHFDARRPTPRIDIRITTDQTDPGRRQLVVSAVGESAEARMRSWLAGELGA